MRICILDPYVQPRHMSIAAPAGAAVPPLRPNLARQGARPKLSRRYISFTGVDRTPHWHGIRIEGMHPESALLFTSAKVGAGYVCTLSVCLSVNRIITQKVVAEC